MTGGAGFGADGSASAGSPQRRAADAVVAVGDDLVALSHEIAADPELSLQEDRAAARLVHRLERGGFGVVRGVADLATSFAAVVGDTSGAVPHLVVCAEYDALPGIGHACGHNMIAAAAVGAGLALAPLASELGFGLTVLGCPAEEAVGGKAALVDAGVFDGVDAAMMVHPAPAPFDLLAAPALALRDLRVTVTGQGGHAALTSTRRRRSALETLCDVHLLVAGRAYGDWERCGGVIRHGGDAANVVPTEAVAHYLVRARDADALAAFEATLRDEIATAVEAAGCTVAFDHEWHPYADVVHNTTLAQRYREHAQLRGREFVPDAFIGPESATSTDMGNVSHVVPSIHPMIGIDAGPHLPHQAGFAAAAVAPAADVAIVDAAASMAATVLDLVCEPELLTAVRAEFAAHATGAGAGAAGAGD